MNTRTRTRSAGARSREFEAGKTGGDDATALDLRHDETKAVERMTDLAASIAEADDGAAGVLDRGKLGGELGMQIVPEVARRRASGPRG